MIILSFPLLESLLGMGNKRMDLISLQINSFKDYFLKLYIYIKVVYTNKFFFIFYFLFLKKLLKIIIYEIKNFI